MLNNQIRPRKVIKLPHSKDITDSINMRHVNPSDIARNLASDKHPNGLPTDLFKALVKLGLNDHDYKVVMSVVTELCKQQRKRNSVMKKNQRQFKNNHPTTQG